MIWYDWLLIAVLLLGMVIRVIGRSIRAHANLKYGNDPDRKEKQVRLGTTLSWIGAAISILTAIGLLIALSIMD